MNDTIELRGTVEITAASADGKRPTLSIAAYQGGALELGWGSPVVVALDSLTTASQNLPVLASHDPERPLGHTTSVAISRDGVKATGIVSSDAPHATEIVAMSRNGFPWSASIGASAGKKEYVRAGESVAVNGRKFAGPVIVSRGAQLREISVLSLGADPTASTSIAAKRGRTMNEFDTWLTSQNFDPAALSDDQKNLLRASWPGESGGSVDAERQRVAKIEAALERYTYQRDDDFPNRASEIAAKAVQENWTVDKAELELMRAARPQVGVPRGRSVQAGQQVIEAGLLMAGGMRDHDVAQHYDSRTVDAATSARYRSIGLQGLLRVVLQAHGRHCSPGRLRDDDIRAAFECSIKAGTTGPSTYSLPNILSNTANKFALQGFLSGDNAWSQICGRRPVNDFKQITSVRLTGTLRYRQLAPGGEIRHGELGERAYNNQARTYAILIGIRREDWINDDTSVLSDTAKEMGIGALDAINNEFWTTFLNNTGSFFVAGNNNISTGALSLANVAAADSVFRKQTKPNGTPLGLMPSILLVPSELRVSALNIVNSTVVVDGTATGLSPSGNALANSYTVVSSPFMSNTAFTGNSAVAYYLLANPSLLPVIEGAFLDGRETPTVQTADFDFNQLGTALRGFLDFGFALQEFRGGVRSTGA